MKMVIRWRDGKGAAKLGAKLVAIILVPNIDAILPERLRLFGGLKER